MLMKKSLIILVIVACLTGGAFCMTQIMQAPADNQDETSDTPKEPDIKRVCELYLQVLKDAREEIDVENSSGVKSLTEEEQECFIKSDNVALYDITGDDVPELFAQCYTSDNTPNLRIYTVDGESVRDIKTDITSVIANCYYGSPFILSSKTHNKLYEVRSGGEPSVFSVVEYELENGRFIQKRELFRGFDLSLDPEYTYSITDSGSNVDVSKEEFNSCLDEILSDIDVCIFDAHKPFETYGLIDHEFYISVENLAKKGSSGMKYADMIEYLESKVAGE